MFNSQRVIPKQNEYTKLVAKYGEKTVKEAFASARGKNLQRPIGYITAICKKKAAEKPKKNLNGLVDEYIKDTTRRDRPELESIFGPTPT